MVIARRGNSVRRVFALWAAAWGLYLVTGSESAWAQAKGAWQAEWERTLEAAKKEGRVVVFVGGGAGSEVRRIFSEEFQKQFPQIKADVTIGGGGGAPRVLTERRAGKFVWDVYSGGTTTVIEYLVPGGVVDPIKPALILPEVTDPKKWFGGAIDFADDAATYNLVFGGYVKPPLVFHSRSVKGNEVRSYWDLLDPKWRGKISLHDPRAPGSGLAAVTFWYGAASLGKEYIKRFLDPGHEVKVVRDYRQQLEWIARGDQIWGIGHNNSIYSEFVEKGLPLGQLTADDIKEANYVTAAIASVALVNRAPNPNAAKVFINWLLNKEAQTQFSQATGFWSRRLDVPQNHLDPAVVPKLEKLSSYQLNYKEEWVKKRREIDAFLRTIMK